MTKRRNRSSALLVAGVLGGLMGAPAWALNPQPEVPSKQGQRQDWRALNPQPEVPSKPSSAATPKALNPQPEVPSKPSGAIAPKALNPQPEVPSKAQKGAQKKKSAKPPGSASGS